MLHIFLKAKILLPLVLTNEKGGIAALSPKHRKM